MGMVFEKTARVTDVSFMIDDGTGRIGCKRWLSSLICFTMDIDLNPLVLAFVTIASWSSFLCFFVIWAGLTMHRIPRKWRNYCKF